MRRTTKQYLSGTICVICAVGMVLSISRMIPYGLAGEVGKVKLYFSTMIAAFVVSLPASVAYYYYRDTSDDEELERMRVATTALSHIGQKNVKPRQATPVSVQVPTAKKGKKI